MDLLYSIIQLENWFEFSESMVDKQQLMNNNLDQSP